LLDDPDQRGYAFLILLDDAGDSHALAQLLARLRHPESPMPAAFLVPPTRGLAFFADPGRQSELDAWWSVEVPGSAHPVYLVMDAEGLEEWLQGVDGTFYIGVREAHRMAAYAADPRARPFTWMGPLDFATAVMHDHSTARSGGLAVFDQGDALRMAALGGRLPLRPEGETGAVRVLAAAADLPPSAPSVAPPANPYSIPPLVAPPAISHPIPPLVAPPAIPHPNPPPVATPATPDRHEPPNASPSTYDARSGAAPFSAAGLFAAESPRPVPAGGPPRNAGGALRRPGGGALSRVLRSRRAFRPRQDADLAQQLAGRGTTIVVTGSRKGGVGKTSFAAGIAIAAGTVLDQIGHMACIVDANIANPDAWGQMNLPAEAATVRDTVGALLSNRDTPPPIHATTPALACYPEVRDATEYSRTAIRRLAEHLRRRYTLIVIDMSNRLPDPTAGPEAAVAAYWLEVADALVLPTTSARADFNGALDYLDVGGLPPTVVAYIVPTSRRLRDNPATLEYVHALRQRAMSLVEVPDDANAVRLAGMEGVPVEQLSSRLRLAYRELTEVIAAMPRRIQA
jgi:MinD-like ATPase involved in chromosome partitioning or flagellar assembly